MEHREYSMKSFECDCGARSVGTECVFCKKKKPTRLKQIKPSEPLVKYTKRKIISTAWRMLNGKD